MRMEKADTNSMVWPMHPLHRRQFLHISFWFCELFVTLQLCTLPTISDNLCWKCWCASGSSTTTANSAVVDKTLATITPWRPSDAEEEDIGEKVEESEWSDWRKEAGDNDMICYTMGDLIWFRGLMREHFADWGGKGEGVAKSGQEKEEGGRSSPRSVLPPEVPAMLTWDPDPPPP